MENRPAKWTLTEAQQKLIDEYRKSNKPIKPPKPITFNIEGFKLVKPRLQTKTPQKQNPVDDRQHPLSPKPIKTTSQENDSTTTQPQPQTPDISEDLYELYKNAPDNYLLRQSFKWAIEKESQNKNTS